MLHAFVLASLIVALLIIGPRLIVLRLVQLCGGLLLLAVAGIALTIIVPVAAEITLASLALPWSAG